MNFEKSTLFQIASMRMQWLSDRQKVVSENIANADTSEYRAKDVESFTQYLDRADGTSEDTSALVFEDETSWGASISGNNVVLEEQILKASSAASEYRMASSLYRKAHEMLLTVSSGR